MCNFPSRKNILYALLRACAGLFEMVLSVFPRPRPSDEMVNNPAFVANTYADIDCFSKPSYIEGMSDEEVLSLKRTPVSPDPLYCHTFWLGEGLVLKETLQFDDISEDCHEVNALNLVRSHTSIPVPRVRRVIQVDERAFFIVMDRVRGKLLSEVWNTLSIWRKISITLQLRRYIIQLRRFTKSSLNTPAGPISVLGARSCENPRIFGPMRSRQGPFHTHIGCILQRAALLLPTICPIDQPLASVSV
jgi:hypothetical protein